MAARRPSQAIQKMKTGGEASLRGAGLVTMAKMLGRGLEWMPTWSDQPGGEVIVRGEGERGR